MLRNTFTRKRAEVPFICWQCLAKSGQNALQSPRQRHLFSTTERSAMAARGRGGRSLFAANKMAEENLKQTSDIRDRLKQWEQENVSNPLTGTTMPQFLYIPTGEKISNLLTAYTADGALLEEEEVEPETNEDFEPFQQDQLADVGGRRTFLLPGDLVELIFSGSRAQELAVFVRDLGMQGQYYTMSGRWAQRAHFQPKYYLPAFVKAEDLNDLIPYLPDTSVSPDLQGKIQSFKQALPRNIGKDILGKLGNLWSEANAAYLASAGEMEAAHSKVAHNSQTRYATLEEIAEEVLPRRLKLKNGKFPAPAVYALHRRILEGEIGIHAQSKGTLRAGGEYEIVPLHEIAAVQKIVEYTRTYVERRMAGHDEKTWGPLHAFAVYCQRLIDQSRQKRQFTKYGMVGPWTVELGDASHSRDGSFQVELGPAASSFVQFMESWCGLKNFSRGSALHGIGSTILRAVDRYHNADALDQRTGWTFLQEIGVLQPWATPQPFILKLPNAGLRLRSEVPLPTEGFSKDKLAYIRKNWADLPVYCIDDVGAHEIDDGLSVESTENPDEYWIHIHVADPASHIATSSDIAKYAQKFVTNAYLPDQMAPMIDPNFIQSHLTLAPGRPCLTFSAKVDAGGNVLDYNVSPGTINNVTYVTPAVLAEVGLSNQQGKSDEEDSYAVGASYAPKVTPSRTMTSIDRLSQDQRQDLKMLRQLGLLRLSLLQKQGGMDMGSRIYNMAVHFDGQATSDSLDNKLQSVSYSGDPIIEISTNKAPIENSSLSYLMLLAAEICAKWCHERGIPTIYRVTPRNPSKDSPANFFRNVVAPSRDANGEIPREIKQKYISLIGAAQPSTIPGPHATVGAEMLSKCTSPLRRYGDLLMHWQIGAALEEEARRGQSLIGNTNETIFPFSTSDINRILPRLDTRERVVKRAGNDARNSWFCQWFVRAWKFGEAKLPERLAFKIRHASTVSGTATGTLEPFHAPATLRDLRGVREGEEVEVEVVDVDVPEGRIYLQQVGADIAE